MILLELYSKLLLVIIILSVLWELYQSIVDLAKEKSTMRKLLDEDSQKVYHTASRNDIGDKDNG